MKLHVLGKAKDLRTKTHVVYAQISVKDYLALVGDTFNKFEAQRKREDHPAYKRMKQDIAAGALVPAITLSVKPEFVSMILPLLKDDDFKGIEHILSKSGRVNILDGLQRTYILKDLEKDLPAFKRGQTVHLEIWVEKNSYNFIYRVFVLNSGHKPMSFRHRIRLVFLTIKSSLEHDIRGLKILYDSHEGRRKPRQYRMERVITSFLSFLMKTPEVSIDNPQAHIYVENDIFSSRAQVIGETIESFKNYLKSYSKVDAELCRIYPSKHEPAGIDFMGNQSVMNAFFAAAGSSFFELEDWEKMDHALETLIAMLKQSTAGDDPIGLLKLNKLLGDFNPRKHNIGYETRRVLTMGFRQYFQESGIKALIDCWEI